MISVYDWVKNMVGKGENALYQHFLLFPKSFLSFLKQISILFYISSSFDESEIFSSGNGLSLSQTTNLNLFQAWRVRRWQFQKRVENTGGKWEIARYDQFLLFPQCFQKTYTADM